MRKFKFYYDPTYTPQAERVEQIKELLEEIEELFLDYEIELIDTKDFSSNKRSELYQKAKSMIAARRRLLMREIFGLQGSRMGKIPALFVSRNDELEEFYPCKRKDNERYTNIDIETQLNALIEIKKSFHISAEN